MAIWLGIVLSLAAGQAALWMLHADAAGNWAWTASLRLPPLIASHVPGLLSQAGKLWFLVACGTVLMVLGLVDDRRGLDWRLRLAVQTAVAIAVVSQGWRVTLFLEAPLFTGALSVLWIVGLINSFNMLDNMDGLSGGVAMIAGGMLAVVLLNAPDPQTAQPQLFVAGFLLVLVGAVAGFLWHNRPPATLFMGDAGSYFIGYWLAIATIMATFSGGNLPRHAILAPLCVLAVPLYDTISVLWIRIRSGRSPFEADKNHFSHRLVELGLNKTQAVLTIYLTTATCGLGAFLLHEVDLAGACVVMLIVGCVLTLIAVLETAARRHLRKKTK